MRFSRHRRPRTSTDDAILPLTNIVFLLLIFFMLAGHLASPQPFDIKPPQSTSQTSAADQGIHVDVAANGVIALDGQRIALAKLAAAVHKRLAAKPHAPLQLKADGRNEARHVVAVMHVLHKAGAHKLRLITVAAQS